MSERTAGEEPGAVPPWGTPPERSVPPQAVPPQAGPPPAGPPHTGPPPESPSSSRQHGSGHARRRAGQVAAGLGIGAALVSKAGLIGKALLALKAIGVLAKFKAAGSMIISVGAYAIFWGWKFALGFVLLLAVHEIGHVIALRAQGVPASAPMFIPFLGAFVEVKGEQRSVAEEAWSALAGPIAGTVGAFATLQLADLSGSTLLQALAYTAFLLNLFNLIPTLPLDGGRVAGALHPAIWWAGMLAVIGLILWRPNPVLFLVLVLGGIEALRRWRAHRRGESNGYFDVPAGTRGLIALAYVTVAVACAWGMHASYVPNPL